MSFYSHFRKKCIPEWREYYISYKVFKQLFMPFKKTTKVYGQLVEENIQLHEKMYSLDSNDVGEEIDQLKVFEEKFMTLIVTETEKIDSFFQLKFMEFQEEWGKIQENSDVFKPYRFEKSFYKKAQMLKNAFHLFYMKVNYLIQYVNLNYDAISRLLRKHRKLTKNYSKMMQVSELKIDDLFKNRYINQNSESLVQMRDDVTSTYLDLFFHRYNKDRGVKELKNLLKTRIISIWHSYFLFFFLGCTICLLIFIFVMAIYGSIDPDDDDTFRYIFPMFRGSGFIVLYIWCLGWNVYTWTRYHINYKKIFQFNYHASTPTEILMRGTFFSSISLIIFIWYIIVNENMGNLADGLNSLRIPKEFLPMILWVLLLAYMFFPSRKLFNGEGRRYFFERMFRFLISPCFLIDYPTGWVADQLMSFVIPLQDFAYTICYYSSRIQDYDNMHPASCFTDSIFIGFFVAFFPGLFRTIHFLHYLKLGQEKINMKRKEIEKIQNENKAIAGEKTESLKKNDESVEIKKKEDPKPSINQATEIDDKTQISPTILIIPPSENKKINNENNISSTNEKNPSLDAFEFIEENIPYSATIKKSLIPIKENELLDEKLKELQTLKDSHHLNIMYTCCLVIVMLVIVFSFLYGKYPENNLFLGLWITFAFILSTYAFYLDVAKDWALFQKNKKHPFLREKLGYQKKSIYYIAIILNFFLRYVWVFSISPGTSSKFMKSELFIFFMGGFEMLRRAIWNFMVVEKIFVTNLESYKCLYEYKLPFAEEEVERMYMENVKNEEEEKIKRKQFSMFQSSDYEDDFKVRFRKNKKPDELKKGLLEEFQEVLDLKEEKKDQEEENDKAKTASSREGLNIKLNESLLKGKEVLDSFISIEKDVKSYEEILNRRYDSDLRCRQDKKKTPFEVIMNCFNRKKNEDKKLNENK